MNILHSIKTIIENILHITIYKNKPFGINVFNDIKLLSKKCNKINIMFDVGANIGQSVDYFKSSNQNVCIYSFEPVKETYQKLLSNTQKYKDVKCFNLGMGEKSQEIQIEIDGISQLNSIVNTPLNSSKIETINISTLDEFCKENNISYIDYLKIDTEGYDFEVLKGAKELLKNSQIGFIQIELGINKNNNYHVSFELVKTFLEEHNYFIFGFYDQVREWKEDKNYLRCVRPVFISNSIA